MSLTLSPPVRIAAVCALVATFLIGGGLYVMGGRSTSSVATPHIIKHHPFGPAVQAAPKAKATPAPKAAPKAKHQTATPRTKKTAATRPAAPAPTLNHGAVTAALKAGLPAPVAQALGRDSTVVVSLYDPYSQVDGISFAEARAGAALANVPFVPLNVLSQAQVGKLTEQLGLLPDPGLLVYVRPGRLAVKISGFADKETVAQAALNAAHGT